MREGGCFYEICPSSFSGTSCTMKKKKKNEKKNEKKKNKWVSCIIEGIQACVTTDPWLTVPYTTAHWMRPAKNSYHSNLAAEYCLRGRGGRSPLARTFLKTCRRQRSRHEPPPPKKREIKKKNLFLILTF